MKECRKMKTSNGIEFLNLVLKRYCKSMENDFWNEWEPCL